MQRTELLCNDTLSHAHLHKQHPQMPIYGKQFPLTEPNRTKRSFCTWFTVLSLGGTWDHPGEGKLGVFLVLLGLLSHQDEFRVPHKGVHEKPALASSLFPRRYCNRGVNNHWTLPILSKSLVEMKATGWNYELVECTEWWILDRKWSINGSWKYSTQMYVNLWERL